MYLNKLMLMGNVGKSPEEGKAKGVVSFPLGVGMKGKDTMWVTCDCWEKQAEVALKYVKKGDPLYVEGALSIRNVKKDDGNWSTFISCRVFSLQMLGGKPGEKAAVDKEEEDGGVPW